MSKIKRSTKAVLIFAFILIIILYFLNHKNNYQILPNHKYNSQILPRKIELNLEEISPTLSYKSALNISLYKNDEFNRLSALVTEFVSTLSANNEKDIHGDLIDGTFANNTLISIMNRKNSTCNKWKQQHNALYKRIQTYSLSYTEERRHFLSVVALVINYDDSIHSWSVIEIREWLRYLFYAGVDHAYIYDGSQLKGGSQKDYLVDYIEQGLLTYHDFTEYMPYFTFGTQFFAYQHSIDYYKEDSTWHLQLDIDEYIFSIIDYEPGFLKRQFKSMSESKENCEQILFKCHYMIGIRNPKASRVAERSYRIHPKFPIIPERFKTIYNPRKAFVRVHENVMIGGSTYWADDHKLVYFHYQVDRDTESETIPNIRMLHVATLVDLCEIENLPETDIIMNDEYR